MTLYTTTLVTFRKKIIACVFYDFLVDNWMTNAAYVLTLKTFTCDQIWWQQLPIYEHLQCIIPHTKYLIFRISFDIVIIDMCRWNSENCLPKNIQTSKCQTQSVNWKYIENLEWLLTVNDQCIDRNNQHTAVRFPYLKVCWLNKAFK